MSRQIVLDTETTGLEPSQGHRIIEIGCVELIERRATGNDFHQYLQPDRVIDAGAVEVHGITNEFLEDKPRFEDIVQDFMDYIKGAELIIHNAPFDVGFIDAELKRLSGWDALHSYCTVVDTLVMARHKHPGQRNSLDALCSRYDIDNSQRQKHGALLDAEILAEVYLAMTGGQSALSLEDDGCNADAAETGGIRRVSADRPPLKIIRATETEQQQHQRCLQNIQKATGVSVLWTDGTL
ncbi:MAG TPA: DNA polymerase III subunit epsilon [Thiolapillus brandeum]|uniref:DNA polymerase III subunit epsilon n=1 Tax=Thiolapillus brandeum TaxID=1076588 RepID=A0A831NYD0_9GAMM|nr:DNA polymerase III subunit epsilon [Thiolapillus brandeum]